MNESVDRRILAAFCCVNAITGNSVLEPLPVIAPQWSLKPNRSGVYVIFDGPGLRPLTTQFVPSSTWPSPVTFEVAIQDPSLRYLPRRVKLQAPLKVPAIALSSGTSLDDPARAAALQDPTSVFSPEKVTMFPAPSATVAPNWAVIRASAVRSGVTPTQGLPWAVLQVVRNSDNKVLATGMADSSGEALLAVLGLKMQESSGGAGPVTVSSIAVTVTAWFDPAILDQPRGWITNPDDILSNLANPQLKKDSQTLSLGAGQEFSMIFPISA
jgi:hypothetical protein